ncbi:iron chelate uptake ABC transporter family permease subunit [Streptomyces sp. NPDC002238]
MPRVALALLVGSSLGCAGALMQGVFGSPVPQPTASRRHLVRCGFRAR